MHTMQDTVEVCFQEETVYISEVTLTRNVTRLCLAAYSYPNDQ